MRSYFGWLCRIPRLQLGHTHSTLAANNGAATAQFSQSEFVTQLCIISCMHMPVYSTLLTASLVSRFLDVTIVCVPSLSAHTHTHTHETTQDQYSHPHPLALLSLSIRAAAEAAAGREK